MRIGKYITPRGWRWIMVLWVCTVFYYAEFFDWLPAAGLAVYMTALITLMLLTGYRRMGTKIRFPLREFVVFTLAFSIVRFLYVYYFLSLHLPDYTIFHNPRRALPSIIFGSASLLFLGYSYAVYEWGLAAREKYTDRLQDTDREFDQPLKLRCGGKTVYVLPQDITYVKANGEYVDYQLGEKKYTCFQRLKTVESELEPLGFQRTHRSYIVNPTFVLSIDTSQIELTDGTLIPLSKTYRKRFT